MGYKLHNDVRDRGGWGPALDDTTAHLVLLLMASWTGPEHIYYGGHERLAMVIWGKYDRAAQERTQRAVKKLLQLGALTRITPAAGRRVARYLITSSHSPPEKVRTQARTYQPE